jgi:hypothetical protein
MTGPRELLIALETGPSHRFSDWPNPSVPKVAAGVYSVWEQGRLGGVCRWSDSLYGPGAAGFPYRQS